MSETIKPSDLPKLDRSKGAKFTLERENPATGFTEIIPDPHPLADPRIQEFQQHRFVRRDTHKGQCDLCGQTYEDHVKYFASKNTDAKGTPLPPREVDKAEIAKIAAALPKIPTAEDPEPNVEV